MPSRRAHEKSRHGCRQCKIRRVKCDTQKPKCGNCKRRGESCEPPFEPFQIHSSSRSQTPTLQSSELNSDATIAEKDVNLEDLELLHHFVTVVYLTLSNGSAIQRMWQIDLPKEAISHPYLMHGILAFSALHLVHLSPHNTEKYRQAAVRHQDTALAALRPLLNQVTAQNCDAVCGTSTIVAMFAAGLHQVYYEPKNSPIDKILEIGEFARGVHVVVQVAAEWYRKGKMGPMMNLIPWDNAPPLAPDIRAALEELHNLVELSESNEKKKTLYRSSIHQLKGAFEATAINSYHPSLCFSWLVFIDHEMFDLMKQHDPMALIILAHFGVILQGSSSQWWSGNWGEQILQYAADVLGDDFLPKLAWPAMRVQTTSSPQSFMPGLERFIK